MTLLHSFQSLLIFMLVIHSVVPGNIDLSGNSAVMDKVYSTRSFVHKNSSFLLCNLCIVL